MPIPSYGPTQAAYEAELARARRAGASIMTSVNAARAGLAPWPGLGAETEMLRRAGDQIIAAGRAKPKSLLGPLFNAAPEPEPTKSLFASSTLKPNPNNYDFSPPKYGSYVPRYPPGTTRVPTLMPPRPGDVIPKPYDPNLGGYPGYATPISGIGRGSPVAPTAHGQRPLTERANTGLVPFVDPYQARPMYGERDPVTGQYELLGWNTLAGGQRELPQKHWLSEDYANRFSNPIAVSGAMRDMLEANPQAGLAILAKGMPSQNAQRWLMAQLPRFQAQYQAESAQRMDPQYGWIDFLKGLDLGQEYQNATPYERGERSGSLVPFARRLGY